MNGNVRIARELMRIAKTLTAGSNLSSVIEDIIGQFGFKLSDVSQNSTDMFFAIPEDENADCKGLFGYFNCSKYGRMVTGDNGEEYGMFKVAVTPRYGFCIMPV